MFDGLKEALTKIVTAHPVLYLASAFAFAIWIAACAYWWWNQEHHDATDTNGPNNGLLLVMTSLSALLGFIVIVLSIWPEIPTWLQATRILFLLGLAITIIPFLTTAFASYDAKYLHKEIASFKPKKPAPAKLLEGSKKADETPAPEPEKPIAGNGGYRLTSAISVALGLPIMLFSFWTDPPSWVKPTSILSGVGVAIICFSSLAFGFAHHRWLALKREITKLRAAKKADLDRRNIVAAKLGLDP